MVYYKQNINLLKLMTKAARTTDNFLDKISLIALASVLITVKLDDLPHVRAKAQIGCEMSMFT
jgi:hypothetical protein